MRVLFVATQLNKKAWFISQADLLALIFHSWTKEEQVQLKLDNSSRLINCCPLNRD